MLPQYRLEGVVATIASLAMLRDVRQLGVPAVNLSGRLRRTGIPSVTLDDMAIGRMAAEYFLARGYRHYAYLPTGYGPAFAIDRGRGFVVALRAHGFGVSWFHGSGMPVPPGATPSEGTLANWLSTLPKPVALFAAQDILADEAFGIATATGLQVPEQVSILGVDNDRGAHYGDVGISSIETPMLRLGYEGAALLDRILDGTAPPEQPTLLPPVRIITRTSSDAHAVADRAVLDAMRFIRDHAHERVGVDDVVRAARTSRRSLERRFESVLRSTVLAEIQQARILRVKRLLLQTRMTIQEVSDACGFGDRNRFFVAFRSVAGQAPTAFRASPQA